MLRRLRPVVVALFALWFLVLPSYAAGGNFVSPDQVDFSRILAPPPGNDSAEAKAELAEVLATQQKSSAGQMDAAAADATSTVFQLANILGPKFTAENLPKAEAFFKKLKKDEGDLIYTAKEAWKRPRPFLQSSAIKACSFVPANSPSYPSGHSTFAYMNAVILSNMLPEKKAEIFSRSTQYAHNRIVCGVHYPSDVEAGRIAGSVIAAFMMQNAAFKEEYTGVKSEIRKVLGFE